MEEYLKRVLEQIRCKKAHPHIEQELRDHLDDQIHANVLSGMKHEQAVKEAVRDMGDPVETGIMLDGIHKPQMAWKMVILIGVVSIIGLMIHLLICNQLSAVTTYNEIAQSSKHYIVYMLAGIIVMFILYWIDYTVVARYARSISVVLIALALLTVRFGLQVNGAAYWLTIGGVVIPIRALMLLYVPVYGGVLYKHYKKGYKGLLASILWMIVPVVVVLRMPSLLTAFVMLVSMLIMLTITIMKGWFEVSKRVSIISIWSVFGILPIIGVLVGYRTNRFSEYQINRLQSFMSNSGDTNYLTGAVRDVLANARLIGDSGIDLVGSTIINGVNADYMLSYLFASYGLLVGIAICCVIAVVCLYVFWIARIQKNQLGMIIGLGCGMVLATNLLLSILVNVGAIPPSSVSLPFLSAGGGNSIISYALIGIILGIYRYKNVYTRNVYVEKKRQWKRI